MKYQNIHSFEKHLTQSAKLPLSHVFLVASPCSYERRKIVDKIFYAIASQGKEVQFLSREVADTSLEDSLEELNTLSLFSGEKVLYLNGIDKLKKGDLALLTAYVAKPSSSSYLILGSSSSKGLADLYAKGKKELIACDLSEEKPWELKNRLKKMLVDQADQSKKRFSPDAVDLLLELVGPSLPNLEKEVDKLITYCMERSCISLADVRLLCSAQKAPHLWELVDQIVWGILPCKIEESVDLSLLLPLFSQIKNQLQQGMTVATLAERGVPFHEMAPYLPTVKPSALEKLLSPARQRPIGFFKRALDLLFEAELMAKNSGFDPGWILDLFLSKFHLLKRC